MAIATLSIDLVAQLSKFEADMGRAARIAETAANRIDRSFVGVGAVFTGSLLESAFKEALRNLVDLVPALVQGVAQFQDLEEKTGASAVALAGFQTAADVAGISTDQLAGFMVKLTGTLSKTNDESKGAGGALKALGLDLKAFRDLAPEQQFETLAQRLATFQDGAGKTAIAIALFGKAGAEALPFLKELGQQTGNLTRLTAEQIKQADDLTDRQTRLRSELRQAAQLVALQALPAFTALTEQFAKAATEALGLDTQADKLSSNTGVRDFAQSAVIGVATVAEAIAGLMRGVLALKGSFESVFADVKFLNTLSTNISPTAGGLSRLVFSPEARAEVSAALEERNRVAKEANERYVKLFTDSGTQVSDALRKQFESSNRIADDPELASEQRRLLNRSRGALSELKFQAPEDDKAARNAQREADQQRRALLDQALKNLESTFASERDAITFQQRYLDAQQQQGLVSLQDYYTRRGELQQRGLDIELGKFREQEQALKAALNRTTDPSDRVKVQTQIQDVQAQAARARTEFSQRTQLELLNEQRAYEQLTQRVREFAAELLELQGDAAGAAGLRAQAAIDAARRSATQLGLGAGDLQAFEDATRATQALGNAQRDLQRVNSQAAEAEERFLLAARQRGASQVDVERGLYALRADSLAQMATLLVRAEQLADQARQQAQQLGIGVQDNPAVQFAAQLRLEFERAADAVDPLRTRLVDLADEVGKSWAGALEDALLDGDWEKAGETIRRDLTRGLLNETVTQPVQQALSSLLKGGIGAPGTNTGGGLFTLLGGFLGRGSAATTVPGFAGGQIDVSKPLDVLGTSAAESAAKLAGLGKDSALVSQIMGLLPSAAITPAATAMSAFTVIGVQPATYSLAAMAVMADAAAASLAMIAAQGGSGVAGGLGDLFKLFGSSDLGSFGFGTPFAAGGYTGHAPVHKAVGEVHGQEFVFSAPAVRRIGVPVLEELHRSARRGAPRLGLPGYADGGLVGPWRGGSAAMARGPAPVLNVPVHIHNNMPGAKATTRRRSDGGMDVFIDEAERALGDRIDAGVGLARNISSRFTLNDGASLPR
jgi:hypothetical protein